MARTTINEHFGCYQSVTFCVTNCVTNSVTCDGLLIGPNPHPGELAEGRILVDAEGGGDPDDFGLIGSEVVELDPGHVLVLA